MTKESKIADIELELSRTQVNKGTMHHICYLREKLMKYKRELYGNKKKSELTGEAFVDYLNGDGRIGIVGLGAVGKTSIFEELDESFDDDINKYVFDGYTCKPGIIENDGRTIELIDIPSINESSSHRNKKRIGLDIAKTCDGLLVVIDGSKEIGLKDKIVEELEGAGIRINGQRPNIQIEQRERDGISFIPNVPQSQLTTEVVTQLLKDDMNMNGINVICNCNASIQDLLDVVTGDVHYIPALFVVSKVDVLDEETIDELNETEHTICVSTEEGIGMDVLREKLWELVPVIRVYARNASGETDFDNPVSIPQSKATVEYFCYKKNQNQLDTMKYALVWGTSVEHSPQRVNKAHYLHDEDVVEIITR